MASIDLVALLRQLHTIIATVPPRVVSESTWKGLRRMFEASNRGTAQQRGKKLRAYIEELAGHLAPLMLQNNQVTSTGLELIKLYSTLRRYKRILVRQTAN